MPEQPESRPEQSLATSLPEPIWILTERNNIVKKYIAIAFLIFEIYFLYIIITSKILFFIVCIQSNNKWLSHVNPNMKRICSGLGSKGEAEVSSG